VKRFAHRAARRTRPAAQLHRVCDVGHIEAGIALKLVGQRIDALRRLESNEVIDAERRQYR
jgi:hypothetical protein